MRRLHAIALIFVLTITLAACGTPNGEYERLEEENASLRLELSNLKSELNEIKENLNAAAVFPDGIDNRYDTKIPEAVNAVKKIYKEEYEKNPELVRSGGYLEIKNTRVVQIKSEVEESASELFGNVDFIVEFSLYSDYYGSGPYYYSTGINDTVVFYKDGTMEVVGKNLIDIYRSLTYSSDYSGFIDTVVDFKHLYNDVFLLLEAER